MTDLPTQAGWLDPDERKWLVNELQSELQAKKALRNYTITEAFCDRRILILIAAYFLALTGAVGNYAFGAFGNDRTHSLVASFGLIAFVYVIAGSLILSLRTFARCDRKLSRDPQAVALSGTGTSTGRCTIQGQECAPIFPPCCPGLVCTALGNRAFCEPKTSQNGVRTRSSWEQAIADKVQQQAIKKLPALPGFSPDSRLTMSHSATAQLFSYLLPRFIKTRPERAPS
jgi:hypothetical protein